jgi:signal transduction histidine kinase
MLAGLYAGEYDSYERTKRLVGADGRVVDVQAGARLVRDADGKPVHLIGVIQDITEQKRAQRERDAAHDALSERNGELQRVNAELEEANLLKLDLMGMLSHDIGTPLASILGYSEILTDSDLTPELAFPAAKIVRAANRIDELRHNVLSMCSLDAAKLQTERTPVVLMTALRDAADAADTDVLIGCPAGAAVLVNPAHLRQIIVNFLTNAEKYAGGATSVTVTEQAGTYTIAVHDHGAGVPVELREHLFERFSRASNATAPGHGLGLHIVASLAEANGGTVSYHNNEPTGSTFALDLLKA